ncbi:hypothetical protein CONCODRAFT_3112 [Conidiobolus coronatus NRRL 28638]|uniref:Uncharacterized protein n=1 Tax=Conidiobolus coronatus (strain ATCC 28846 / CBS 209.66 / NRRL 28638) TaxID=796925 RepID=A0A137PFU0_CONC2|nr:hypothetical protein CONCODRAFT_3112 [Conidiobolus coronatus NRRL 28638]|eukprot:KXN73873.1 hypothetical protein CONCODRAFT_3112 [Conidiobolus coronatus NRRL 28638]
MKLVYYALLLKAGLSLPTPQQQQQYNDMQAYQNFLLPALNSIFNQYSANYQESESSEYSLLDVNNRKALHQEQPSNNNIWFRGSNSNPNTNTSPNTSSNSNTNNSNSNASNARTNSKPEDKKESPESSQKYPSTQKQNSPVNNTSRSADNKPAETQPNNNISSDKTEKKDTNKKDLTPTTTTTTTATATTTSSSSKPTATSGNAEHKESIDMMPSDEVRDIWTKWI